MKISHALGLPFVSLLIASSASADYCINKDLVNLGPPAYDVAVLITGNQPVTFLYNGWPGGQFFTFSTTLAGTNELLHWQNLNGTNDPIPTGNPNGPAQLHVGWCTLNPNNVLNMYWTDLLGAQIPGSIIYQVGGHASASSTPGVQWDNASNHPITVTNVYYTLNTKRLDLQDLTRNNRTLASQLRPVPGGTSLVIPAGASAKLSLPGAQVGLWAVIVHDVTGSGSKGSATDFVQFQVPSSTQP